MQEVKEVSLFLGTQEIAQVELPFICIDMEIWHEGKGYLVKDVVYFTDTKVCRVQLKMCAW